MEVANQPTSSNDYAVAKALNEYLLKIIIIVIMAEAVEVTQGSEISEFNRAYILLTNELEKLYNRNSELAAIRPEPIWKRFPVLKTSTWEIVNEYLQDEDNDIGYAHIARVERLCILAGNDTPKYTPEQKEIADFAETARINYGKIIDAANKKKITKKENDWQIPEYTLTYKPDGTILINNVLKLKKAHAGSTTERLLEQAVKRPDELFKPDLGQTSRNLSTVLNSAGFTATLRQLFFPTVSKSKGIVFRSMITRQQADADKINTTELDLQLKALGAGTEPKST